MYRVTKNTTCNTKTSTLTVTLLNKIESIRRIVTAITVVAKEAWLTFGFNCWQSSRPSLEHIYMNTGSFLSSALWISKSLLSHWLPAIQIFRLSNLIHIPLFKLLSILHVHSWYSDLSLRQWPSIRCHWMSWQFRLFLFEFADQPIPKTLSVIF